MDGVLVADKPMGWTSHDVVAVVKKKLGAKKVGHLGTLDPLATGVLPLVINGATKYASVLDGGKKAYAAAVKLGEATDTYDSVGNVTSSGDSSMVTLEAVERVLKAFEGRISQLPPMFSAIKRNGVPLYKLARKGVVVEREPREVEVFSIEMTGFSLPFVEFRAVCSRGTYIRSICHDLGAALGCGAHMTALRRTGCGEFLEVESVSPESSAEDLALKVIPLERALERGRGESAAKQCATV